MKCSRCEGEHDLQTVLDWTLCAVCRYDTKNYLADFISKGRLSSEALCRNSNWQNVLEVINKHGYLTHALFRQMTGADCKKSRDVICKYRQRGRLLYNHAEKRYYLVEKPDLPKAPWGTRWAQVEGMILDNGYVTSYSFAKKYQMKYSTAKTMLNRAKQSGMLVVDEFHRFRLPDGTVEQTSEHKKAG